MAGISGLGGLFQPLWLQNSMILSVLPAGNGRMWALRAGGAGRIREAPLPGEIPAPEVGTHRRTNACRCHGNGKSSRSLKSSDFEPQIFLGKIFRAQPCSAWPAPSQSRDSPSPGGLGASSGFTSGRLWNGGSGNIPNPEGLEFLVPWLLFCLGVGAIRVFPSVLVPGMDSCDSAFPGFCRRRQTNFQDVKVQDWE